MSFKILSLLCLITGVITISAAPLAPNNQSQAIDKLVEKTMATFQVPGVAIGIVKDGKIIHLQGYGIANLDSASKVDEDTIFKIASNSKAFTTAALAILVDQGKLNWDDKVIKYLPDFQIYDSWVSNEFNIIDLLTHRSGLRIGAGDLMLWPEPTKFTRSEVVHNLRYLKSVTSFRDQYAYDNLLYIVAGEVVAAISGQPWEEFIKTAIFEPLNMQNCFGGGIDTKKYSNLVAPHFVIDDKLSVDNANLINDKTSLMAAAGGVKCSVSDLMKWVNVLLQGGLMENGEPLFSLAQRDTLWQPVTRLPLSEKTKQLDEAHYRGYALGWRIGDYHGHWRISHTGTLSGSMSQIIMLPDQQLGVVILTNQQSGAARNALARGILQEFTGENKIDWVDYYLAAAAERVAKKRSYVDMTGEVDFPEENLIADSKQNRKLLGKFVDPWFGEITLSRKNAKIVFQSKKSPRMTGEVFFYNDNQWWVKWDDRSFDADAWLYFDSAQRSSKVKLSMKQISAAADFSFDFQDLNFIKK